MKQLSRIVVSCDRSHLRISCIRRVEATDKFFQDICGKSLKQLGVKIISVLSTHASAAQSA